MKLIDGHAMIERINELMKRRVVNLTYYDIVKEAVQMQPTIDAVPVVHGRWGPHPTDKEWDVCTACGLGFKRRWSEDDCEIEFGCPYCPNCGAKMDGERRKDDAQ